VEGEDKMVRSELVVPVGGSAIGTIVAVVVALVFLPLQAGISPVQPVKVAGTLTAPGTCIYCPALHYSCVILLPKVAGVVVNWSESHGAVVSFEVLAPSGSTICHTLASSDSCTFVSIGGNYTLRVIPPSPPTISFYSVAYSVSYTPARG
jgi:hypothetical protein